MRRPSIRHLATVGAFALIAVAPLAACGSEPVSPLAGQPGTAAPSPTVSATAAASTPPANAPPRVKNPPAAQKPPKTHTPRPTSPTSSCKGAVLYPVDLQKTELELLKSLCFATGAVLRLQGIGPGQVTWEPESLVSHNYAGGVVDLTFLRPGTVTVKIPQPEQTYTVTVVVRP
jgi:hypothetical protein